MKSTPFWLLCLLFTTSSPARAESSPVVPAVDPAASDRPFYGRVESLGAGVESTDQEGPGLPKVGRDLNWVVVAQRFPVWVHLDSPPPEAMHVGMTASVKVRHGDSR